MFHILKQSEIEKLANSGHSFSRHLDHPGTIYLNELRFLGSNSTNSQCWRLDEIVYPE